MESSPRPPRTRRSGVGFRFLGMLLVAAGLASVWITLRSPARLAPSPDPGSLRVATYNIRAGLGGMSKITEDLRALSADVIALQEVERGVYGSRSIDQAPTLATALGMSFAFAPSFSLEGREHGIAVLSRYPIVASETIELPRGTGRWPRVALKTRIETPLGPVRMVCVHLTRPSRAPFSHTRERLAQLGAMFETLAGDSMSCVLAGDFNSTPLSPERWLVSQHLSDSWIPWRDGWATTFSLRSIGFPWGSVKIDAIYHDRSWRSRGIWVAPRGGSDHRPVVADLVPSDRGPARARRPFRGILIQSPFPAPAAPASCGPAAGIHGGFVIVATDLEGVLIPEIWEHVARASGVPELARTTRDEPDFGRLMDQRLRLMRERGLGLVDLERIARTVDPYPGAVDLLAWLRAQAQIFIVSDTFHELSESIVRRMGGFSLFANRFQVDAAGNIVGVRLRIRGRKDRVIHSVRELGFRVVAIGDSYNDESVLRAADHGILYRAPADLATRLPEARIANDYADIRRHVEEIRRIDDAAAMDEALGRAADASPAS